MKDSELRMIETMLKKQDELNSAIMKEFGLDTISREQIDLATLDEIGEFTHELKGDWCWWKKSQEPVDRNKVLEELADVFHFVLIYELLYGKRTYLTNSGYDQENGQYNYSHMVQVDIGFGIANALITILKLVDCRLMYLLALSEHLGFCLEEIYAAYMRKNAINMERLKNGYQVMWIRSQDKKKLKEIHDVSIYHDTKIWADCSFIGEYSTKEKALLVLDMIEKVSMYQGNTLFQMPQDWEVEV